MITKCHDVTSMSKLSIINVTKHMPHNRVSDTITDVTLNTLNGVPVLLLKRVYLPESRWAVRMEISFCFVDVKVAPKSESNEKTVSLKLKSAAPFCAGNKPLHTQRSILSNRIFREQCRSLPQGSHKCKHSMHVCNPRSANAIRSIL